MSCEYASISLFLESKQTLIDRVNAIDSLVDVMILSMADHAAGTGPTISEYQLDDGQVKIRTAYRSIKEVEDGILALERMKHLYLNRLNGRITILRDEKSYRR